MPRPDPFAYRERQRMQMAGESGQDHKKKGELIAHMIDIRITLDLRQLALAAVLLLSS
jgi:hypothetical protein